MTGNEAYAFLMEAAGYLDEANLEQGLKTLGKKLSRDDKWRVANNVWKSADSRCDAGFKALDRNKWGTPTYKKLSSRIDKSVNIGRASLDYRRSLPF